MRDNFIFEREIRSKDKKYYRYFYPIHCSVKPEVERLFSEMAKRLDGLFLEDDAIRIDTLSLELENTIFLVQDILKTRFPNCFLELFETLNRQDVIKFYDFDSDYLTWCYDNGRGNCNYVSQYLDDCFLYLTLQNEFYDVANLIHELSHFVIGDFQEYFAWTYLGELLPIFSEFVVFDYAIEHFPNHPTIFFQLCERYKEILETLEFSKTKEHYTDTYDYYDRSNYAFCFLLASFLYEKYLNYPEKTMDKIMKFSKGYGVLHFNRLMEILGVKLKYYDGKLHYEEQDLEVLFDRL